MRKGRILFILLLAVTACKPKGNEAGIPPGLLSTVPSDAVAVARCEKCTIALESLLDSSNVLRSIDYGKFSSAPAALSLMYISKLSPLLCIDTGKAEADGLDDLKPLIEQAERKRIRTTTASHDGRRILMLATSETVLPMAQRHLEIGASILDSPGFGDVAGIAAHTENILILRNSATQRLLSGGILQQLGLGETEKILTRKALASFFPAMSDWTVIDMDGNTLTNVHEASPRYMDSFLKGLQETQSAIPVPDGCSFLLDVVTGENFREEYESWLETRSKYEGYLKTLKELGKESGKYPIDWEKELGVREIARIEWDGHTVAVLSTNRKPETDSDIPAENPYRMFLNTLYCRLNVNDSHYARRGNIAVFGTAEDVEAYLSVPTKEPVKGRMTFRLVAGTVTITSDRQSTKFTKN